MQRQKLQTAIDIAIIIVAFIAIMVLTVLIGGEPCKPL